MINDLSRLFDMMPLDRILSGCSSLAHSVDAEFDGPLAAAIAELGPPALITLHLQIPPNDPEWAAFWRADWTGAGTLWGAFDPSAFIALFNINAKVISQTNVLFSIQSPKQLPTETIVLTDSFQPQAVIWDGALFKIAPLFFRQKPPAPPRAIPNFMR